MTFELLIQIFIAVAGVLAVVSFIREQHFRWTTQHRGGPTRCAAAGGRAVRLRTQPVAPPPIAFEQLPRTEAELTAALELETRPRMRQWMVEELTRLEEDKYRSMDNF